MVMPTVATELTKIALSKLAELRPDDVAKAAKALGKAAGSGSMLIPGLGAFGAGLVVGAGVGWLTAPRAGKETRTRILDGFRKRFRALKSRNQPSERVPATEEAVSIGSNGGSA